MKVSPTRIVLLKLRNRYIVNLMRKPTAGSSQEAGSLIASVHEKLIAYLKSRK
jgi:hypothetical protein